MRRLVALMVVLVGVSIVLLASAWSNASAVRSTPTAAEFGRDFVATTNAYSAAHGSAARLEHADCVKASEGHYMCSYAIMRPGRQADCHVMQATWTPDEASTFTVTLAGRTRRCESLRAALGSLG